jgi:hypothetical protein
VLVRARRSRRLVRPSPEVEVHSPRVGGSGRVVDGRLAAISDLRAVVGHLRGRTAGEDAAVLARARSASRRPGRDRAIEVTHGRRVRMVTAPRGCGPRIECGSVAAPPARPQACVDRCDRRHMAAVAFAGCRPCRSAKRLRSNRGSSTDRASHRSWLGHGSVGHLGCGSGRTATGVAPCVAPLMRSALPGRCPSRGQGRPRREGHALAGTMRVEGDHEHDVVPRASL